MNKVGNSRKEIKVFKKYLDCLLFDQLREGKHGVIYQNKDKSLVVQLPSTPSDHRWIKNKKQELCRIAIENWSKSELEKLLEPLIKKRQIQFLKEGKPKLMRKGVDFSQYKSVLSVGGIKGNGSRKKRIMKKQLQYAFDLIELENEILDEILKK